jgi:hypothetical protein
MKRWKIVIMHDLPKLKKPCNSAGTNIKINLWLDNKIAFPYRLAKVEAEIATGYNPGQENRMKNDVKYTNLSN